MLIFQVLTEKRYTQLKDGPQTFVGLIPGVKYDVTVCRVDGDGQWPIMSDIVMYSPAKPEGLASTRQRCESRVCRAYPQPLNTMYWVRPITMSVAILLCTNKYHNKLGLI